MTRNVLGEKDDAVSEIVGEILVLVITVMVFGLLVVAVNAMVSRQGTTIVDISAAGNSSTITLTHAGGDSVSFSRVSVNVNGHVAPYSASASDSNGNGLWEIGETLSVANPGGPGMDVIVYDSVSKSLLGSFIL